MSTAPSPSHRVDPFFELLKLVSAAALGLVITLVHKHYHRDRPLARSLVQAQVLLCVCGALMMVIIGDSLPRALGIAGGAGIVRFRTPVEDPKDSAILFLLLGIGMACGLGAFAVAGLGGAFMCLTIVALDLIGAEKPRLMLLEMVASSSQFPTEHVNLTLARNVNSYEPRDIMQGNEVKVRYHVTMDRGTSLAWLTSELMAEGTA
ncbi:MAG: DUF4956 domain-containing protein, partial [Bryobacteraceae bacterium]